METPNPASGGVLEQSADAMLPESFVIRKVINDTHDTFSLELQSPDDRELVFAPGQFNMLYVFGVGEVPISISGDPAHPEKLVHTTREVGAVTRAIRRLKRGDVLGVRGPFGRPWPIDLAEKKDLLMVAGGIGLAPLRPVLYYALQNRDRYGRVVLLYGSRSPEDVLYHKELEKWRSRFDLEVHITVDRGSGAWRGNVGVVTELIRRSPLDPENCVAMICGPEIMMRFTVLELEKRGVAYDRVFVSMERNMKCGIGLCGHCQIGSSFVCKDGPVYGYDELGDILIAREM